MLKSRDITSQTEVGIVKAVVFSVVTYRCESWTIKRLSTEELMLLNCRALESPLDWKEIKQVNPKGNQPWKFIGRTDAEAKAPILWPWCKELTHWKRPWSWERLWAGGEAGNRGWDGWVASWTKWTLVWANLEIVKDSEAWRATVYGVKKSQKGLKWLNDNNLPHFNLPRQQQQRLSEREKNTKEIKNSSEED